MSKYLCYMPLLFTLFKRKWARILNHVITIFAMCCAHVFYFQHTYHEAHEIRLFLPAGFLCQGYKRLSRLSSLTSEEIRCHRHLVLQKKGVTSLVQCTVTICLRKLWGKLASFPHKSTWQIPADVKWAFQMEVTTWFDLISMEEIWTLDTAVESQILRTT